MKVLRFRYYRKAEDPEVSIKNDFRESYLVYLQLIPAITLAIDMFFNKFKFRFKNIGYTLAYMSLFVIFASRYQISSGPCYLENLNWYNDTINYSKWHKPWVSPSNGQAYGNIFMKEFN